LSEPKDRFFDANAAIFLSKGTENISYCIQVLSEMLKYPSEGLEAGFVRKRSCNFLASPFHESQKSEIV